MKDSNHKIFAIVLAAGKGTRMKSSLAKVLHKVFFAPMINHVMDALDGLNLEDIIVVCGHQAEEVKAALTPYKVLFARQDQQLGTGHAVLASEDILKGIDATAIILCGDTPLIKTLTLQEMIDEHFSNKKMLTVMTTVLDDPTNYGRIIYNDAGEISRIVEEKDATDMERMINEVNAGVYCVELSFLFKALADVGNNNTQGEVYLTDIVEIANKAEVSIGKYLCRDSMEITGVNSRVELAQANKVLQDRRNKELMVNGVTIMDPDTVFIENSVVIGKDTVINPNCYLHGATRIGESCTIGPFSKLNDCIVGDHVTIKSFVDYEGKEININI